MDIDVNRYYEKIDQYEDTYLNKEQKILVKNLIDILVNNKKINKYELDNYFNFFLQRVKTGFTFDEIPKEFNGYISLPKEDKKLSFKGSDNLNNLNHLLFIGENYDVLKNLLITHRGKIDVIYIDPPYNTESAKSDGNFLSNNQEKNSTKKFIYRDKFSRTGWLNMMKERLELAKDLLSNEGVIFVSIDDNEQAYLKVLMDEIFGEENFISNIIWQKSQGIKMDNKFLSNSKEYILFFAKNKQRIFLNKRKGNPRNYKLIDEKSGKKYFLNKLDDGSLSYSKSLDYEFEYKGLIYYPGGSKSKWIQRNKGNHSNKDWCWRLSKLNLLKEIENNNIVFKNNNIYKKVFFNDNSYIPIEDLISFNNDSDSYILENFLSVFNLTNSQKGQMQLDSIFNKRIFDHPKPKELIIFLIKLILNNNKNIIILDFFAGSGTTGHAVMDLNKEDNGSRQFILVTNNENNIAKDICYERLYRVINGKGTKEEKDFKWIEKNKPYKNNNLKVFNLEKIKVTPDIKLNDFLIKKIDEYKNINPEYKTDFNNIFYDLSSLEQSLKEE